MKSSDPVLLVEDNEDDVFFLQRAWQQAGVPNPLKVARDGQDAIDCLGSTGPYADRGENPAPVIVLLDLKLPFRSGHEVLSWIRGQPFGWRCIVIFLTSSREGTDVRKAYESGANGYLVKPASGTQLVEMIKAFKLYWLDYNVT